MRKFPLVMIHGLGGNRKIWAPVLNFFPHSDLVITLDLPGHGDSPDYFPNAIRDICLMIHVELGNLGIDGPINYAGHSLGGLVGLLFASLYPEKMNRLILMNSHDKIDLHPDIVYHILQGKIPSVYVEQSMGKMATQEQKQFAMNEVGPLRLQPGTSNIADLATLELRSEMKKIHCPVLLIVGSEDPVLSPRKATLLSQRIVHSRLIMLPAGHYIHIEQPQRVALEIMQFLKS